MARAKAYGAVSPSDKADPRIIKASVIKFVEAWRSVSSDAWLQRKQIFDAYAFIARADPAYVTLSEYWQKAENEPFARAEKETVSVEVKSVLPVTDNSYQIEWVETIRDRRGKQKATRSAIEDRSLGHRAKWLRWTRKRFGSIHSRSISPPSRGRRFIEFEAVAGGFLWRVWQ